MVTDDDRLVWNEWRGVPDELLQGLQDIWLAARERHPLTAGETRLMERRGRCIELRALLPEHDYRRKLRLA